MPNQDQFDILIIGSGEAGKYLAWTMRRLASAPRWSSGTDCGACPNIACLPSKNIIHSAKVAELTRRAVEFGIATGPVTIDMPGCAQQAPNGGWPHHLHLDRYRASGAELILGEARFVAQDGFEVKMKDGTVGISQEIGIPERWDPGSHSKRYLAQSRQTADPHRSVGMDRVPEHLSCSAEVRCARLAQAMLRFGSRVDCAGTGDAARWPRRHRRCRRDLRLFQEDGIEVLLNTELLEVEGRSGQGIKARLRSLQGERPLEGSIFSLPRDEFRTRRLGLESFWCRPGDLGYIPGNERLQTTAPGVLGDGRMRPAAPVHSMSHLTISELCTTSYCGNRKLGATRCPSACLTDPELARVGLSERKPGAGDPVPARKDSNGGGTPYANTSETRAS